MNNREFVSFLPYILVLGIMLLLTSHGSEGNTENLNHNEFMAKANTMILTKAEMSMGATVIDIKGSYSEKGKDVNFTTRVPNMGKDVSYLADVSKRSKSTDLTISGPNRESLLMKSPTNVFPFLLVVGVVFFMSSKVNAEGSNKTSEFSKSRTKIEGNIKVRFKDIISCDEEKGEAKETTDYLRDPKRFTDIGAHIPKGMLMVDPPDIDKTLLIKAVAGETDVPLSSISGSNFVEIFVGTDVNYVHDMFKKAQQTAPRIAFIDGTDAVGRQYGAGIGGGNDECEQTLNQLLVEMDGMSEDKGIVVIAATNYPGVLDPVLLRSGRLDRQTTVNLPDRHGHYEILKIHVRNKKLVPDTDLEGLAEWTPGFSGANLENVLNEGAISVVCDRREIVTVGDPDEAIDRVMMGLAKKSKKYADRGKRLIAFHETGYAVISLKLNDADKVKKVMIIPYGEAGGYNLMTPEEEEMMPTKANFIAQTTGLMGGRIAEGVIFDEMPVGASSGIQKATKIAKAMVRSRGMSSLGPVQYDNGIGNVFLGRDCGNGNNYSGEIAHEIDKGIHKIINERYDRTEQTVGNNKDLLILITGMLTEEEAITSEQIYDLMSYGKLISSEDKVRATEARTKTAEQKLKDLEAGTTWENTTEEIREDVQSSKESDIDFDTVLKRLTKNDYDEHREQ